MAKTPQLKDNPVLLSLVQQLAVEAGFGGNTIAKSERKGPEVYLADEKNTDPEDVKNLLEGKQSPLVKSILNVLNGGETASIEQLAFTNDPSQLNQYQGLYKAKLRLIPDSILKRIAIQDDLVAAIIQARSSHLSVFGRPPKDRFNPGFVIEPKPGVLDSMKDKPQEKADLQKRIDISTERLITCGSTKGFPDYQKMSFSQFLSISVRNALTVGRISTEIIYADGPGATRVFHSFRPRDAGTVYRLASKDEQAAEKVREEALAILQSLKENKQKNEPRAKYRDEDFIWAQVIEGSVKQVFTGNEMVVHNFYPVSDIELDGYPLTPIDTMIAAVTTHINITTHNKLYFQSGRAAKGMVVVKSDDVDESVIARLKQHFNASINSVANAWRMPVFGINKDADVVWTPIDAQGARDMEFQYLSDNNARVIMSAFQISPEELPGYAHLSRGTNNQALSESNNEYKLEAARDVGLRPLVAQFEDLINTTIFPLFDPELAKLCHVKFIGLDADTAEKESTRLQQDMGVHYTMDEILAQVEKKPVTKRWGGEILFNQQYQALLDKYLTVGDIIEHFFGIAGAAADPQLNYRRDPFWFQQLEYISEQQQLQAQIQAAAQGQPPAGGGQPPPGGGGGSSGGQQQPSRDPQQSPQPPQDNGGGELSRSIEQLQDTLSKNEKLLPPAKRRLLHQQARAAEYLIEGFKADAEAAVKEALRIAEHHLPEPKKE